MKKERIYAAIDLKSFYASVEAQERHMDPMTTNLVVADAERTEKTICLAVSPSLRALGVSGRARLFEVIQCVRDVNRKRLEKAPGHTFLGSSCNAVELSQDPSLSVNFVIASPRMAHYMDCSSRIYRIYLNYLAPEDIHVYSIDEVMLDVTDYLKARNMTAREMVSAMMREVYEQTGITATAGIGTNLYLAKIAMDIVAKHMEPDETGARIAELDEISYRKTLWNHRPVTDFWRVGRGYAKRLVEQGMYTMGDIARCSIGKENEYYNEELLYKMFGVNAELLIDHAWGYEPCTIADIKAYRPENNSFCSGQVLACPYPSAKARLAVQEMADLMALDLVDKRLVTDQVVLTVEYDIENLKDNAIRKSYHGETEADRYGRRVPKHAHGTENLGVQTSSARRIIKAAMALYDRTVNPELLVRRLYLTVNHVVSEESVKKEEVYEQLSLFTDYAGREEKEKQEEKDLARERKMQEAMLSIKKKYGKNAILKGMNLEEGATSISRNSQIGGHKAE